jgi:hypothetical protein
MEILIALVIIVGIAAILWTNNRAKPLDVNQDGKVDVQDLVAIAPVVTEAVVNTTKQVAVRAKKVVAKATSKKTAAAKKPAVKKAAPAKKPKK